MKAVLAIAVVILAVLFLNPSVALAYDPPNQGSDNATDVIIWHGDNETNVIVWDEPLTVALDDTLTVVWDDMFSLALVAFIIALAVSQQKDQFSEKGLFLYIVSAPVAIVYGLSLASGEPVYSFLWVAGVAIAIIGTYFIYKVAVMGFAAIRKRGKR